MVILSIANTFIIGLIVMVIGALLSIITSWILYGFGELIEQTKKTAEYMELLLKSNPTASGFADDDDD